jgi:hypothetical protein
MAQIPNRNMNTPIKRRVFISHHKSDRTEVDSFIDRFAIKDGIFTPYVLGANDNDDYIDSPDAGYVMRKIREKYLQDTTVTIVLVGSCTHSRRYVDWELKSSLRQGEYSPNGVIGIILPSQGTSAIMPPRLQANWSQGHVNCYARYWVCPSSGENLRTLIEDAYLARTQRASLIQNSQEMMKRNARCKVCNVTH